MNKSHVGCVLLFCGTLASCAQTLPSAPLPYAPQHPHASIGDFTDHVLEPLALRFADEKISEAMADQKLARTPKSSTQTLAGVLAELPWVGKLMNVTTISQKARLDQELVWLETRRIPLKRELLESFVSGTTQEEDTFTFCVDSVQRRYQSLDINRFSRLPDGPGPCQSEQLYSLIKTS